ncbi:undecaprenyl pyrophosphate phosphatase [Poriferisphaera corsica]|uniref:Undecaprenyl pyrophosphate phosphatase n=1 Tax=Poriferisphaera corsica TaxID=2528020 RepID=A0A517YWV0_9BACT|nr:phosphatase PAP2 family protein [Poriferisphaera corsica]QDU34696.1 undecaprenyl pyrophosphate phosphatase [Poriferisphaera corsica]
MADSSQNSSNANVGGMTSHLRDRGWHLASVRRDFAITGVLSAIMVVVAYMFIDVRVSWFALEQDWLKPIANVITQFGDTKFYYITLVVALLSTLFLDRGPVKKNLHYWLLLAAILFFYGWGDRLYRHYEWVVIFPAIGVAWLIYRRRDLVSWALFLMLAIAWSGLSVNIVKIIFGRFRPSELQQAGHFGFDFFTIGPANASFPSGHATAAATLATVLWLMYPRQWMLWVVVGLVIAFSRVFTLSHYVSDVVAGLYFGSFMTLVLHYFLTSRRTIHPFLVLNAPSAK